VPVFLLLFEKGEMMIDEISGDLLQWLRGFYFVAEKGSIQQAAIAMGRERPTISRQIQCLEKELGVTLFDRSSGKMMITPEGKILQEGAVELFEYVKQIRGELKDQGLDYCGKISIATTHSIIYTILPPYIENFRRLHSKVAFQFEGSTRERVHEKVESAEADFGIAFLEAGHKTLICHDLFEAGLIMIAPKNNPYFPGKAFPTLKQIAEVPFILFSHRGLDDPQIGELFAKDRLKPNVVMAHNDLCAIKIYVARGMGVSILAGHAIFQEDEQNFDIYSMDRYFPKRQYGILLKKNKYLSPMVKAFVRTIKPDINFSTNLQPSEAPFLSLTALLRRGHQVEKPTVKAGSEEKC
jgi:DNA-binding transcriptional LysR family regulator